MPNRETDLMALLPQKFEELDTSGDLSSFLAIFNEKLNEWLDLCDESIKFKYVDEVPDEYLGYIEEMLGLTPMIDFESVNRRNVVKAMATIWRTKGTEASIKTFVAKALGIPESSIAFTLTQASADTSEATPVATHSGALKSFGAAVDQEYHTVKVETDLQATASAAPIGGNVTGHARTVGDVAYFFWYNHLRPASLSQTVPPTVTWSEPLDLAQLANVADIEQYSENFMPVTDGATAGQWTKGGLMIGTDDPFKVSQYLFNLSSDKLALTEASDEINPNTDYPYEHVALHLQPAESHGFWASKYWEQGVLQDKISMINGARMLHEHTSLDFTIPGTPTQTTGADDGSTTRFNFGRDEVVYEDPPLHGGVGSVEGVNGAVSTAFVPIGHVLTYGAMFASELVLEVSPAEFEAINIGDLLFFDNIDTTGMPDASTLQCNGFAWVSWKMKDWYFGGGTADVLMIMASRDWDPLIYGPDIGSWFYDSGSPFINWSAVKWTRINKFKLIQSRESDGEYFRWTPTQWLNVRYGSSEYWSYNVRIGGNSAIAKIPSGLAPMEKYWAKWEFNAPHTLATNSVSSWKAKLPRIRQIKLDDLSLKMNKDTIAINPLGEISNAGDGKTSVATSPLALNILKLNISGSSAQEAFSIVSHTDEDITVSEPIPVELKTRLDNGERIQYEIEVSSAMLMSINVSSAGYPATDIAKQQAYLLTELRDKFVPANITLSLNLEVG